MNHALQPAASSAGAPATIKMCVDKFVPDDQVSAAEERALAERPDNMRVVSLGTRGLGRPRMALMTQTLWAPGSTLKVRFLDGEDAVQTRVEATAKGWEEYANVHFDFGDDPEAPIRVSFAQEGSWSYLGTVADHMPTDQATMNLGWLKTDTPDEEYARVVLHEFGHALGCIHEHQSPDVRIPWDKEAVYAYYARQGWSRMQVDENLFKAYSPEGIRYSRFDPQSIMLYAVDEALTVGDWAVDWNMQLSEEDKTFIRGQYPFTAKATGDLVPGTSIDTDIGSAGEVDAFRFTIQATGRYVLSTSGPTDLVMSLHGPDNDATLVAADDDSGEGLNARIERDLGPGRYLVQVRHNQPTATGMYRITLAAG